LRTGENAGRVIFFAAASPRGERAGEAAPAQTLRADTGGETFGGDVFVSTILARHEIPWLVVFDDPLNG